MAADEAAKNFVFRLFVLQYTRDAVGALNPLFSVFFSSERRVMCAEVMARR